MMKIRSMILCLGMLLMSTLSLADSWIRVINNSSVHLQAIWQAGGCLGQMDDWEEDVQWTVCRKNIIQPGTEERGHFSMFESDRSVKVFTRAQGRVGYCNSMDYASVTVTDATGNPGMVMVEYNCP